MAISLKHSNYQQEIIAAVIVTFYPDKEQLSLNLHHLAGEVEKIVIVDNTPSSASNSVHASCFPPHEVIPLGVNRGIAFAQNAGIRRASDLGATHVLLLDQDSALAKDGVDKLLAVLKHLEKNGEKVAACCALPCGGKYPEGFPLIVDQDGWPKRVLPPIEGETKVIHTIASGSLIPMNVLSRVGTMKDELFIDYVDIEWGLRAGYMGFSSYVVSQVMLHHSLGDSSIKFLLTDRYIPTYSSFRYYYQMRNVLLLCRMPHVSWRWIAWHIPRVIFIKSIFLILTSKNKALTAREMLRGMLHGLLGKYSGSPKS